MGNREWKSGKAATCRHSRIVNPCFPSPASRSLHFESHLSAGLKKAQAESKQCSTIYLAAVSGGADSTAMLTGLAALRKEAGFILYCVHVEHGIRPPEESQGDAEAVKALCEKLEVPCRVVSIAPGKIAAFAGNGGPGIEGAARVFRRKALHREARRVGAMYILTAHTMDDLHETILMRILRGSGPAGLAAMPPVRGRMLRPLLDLRRHDVLSYLEEKGIPYRTDSTNTDIRFLRNRIRHKLIPLLDEFFPSWRTSLAALAETQSLTAQFLAAEVRDRLSWKGNDGGTDAVGDINTAAACLRLDEVDFFSAPPILREEAIFAGADMLSRAGAYTAVPKRAAVRRAVSRTAAAAVDLGPVRFRRHNGFVELSSAINSPEERGFSLLIKEAGVYTLKGKLLGFNRKSALCVHAGLARKDEQQAGTLPGMSNGVFFAAFPLVLRNHHAGDRIYKGGHKRRFSDILDSNTRSGCTGIITAEDMEGTAAFICVKGDRELLVISREAAHCGGFSPFEVFGGVNA